MSEQPLILGFDANLAETFPREYALLDECLARGDDIYTITLDQHQSDYSHSPFHYALVYLLVRSIPSLVATSQLVSAGFIGEARALLRRSLEALITAKYLSLNPMEYGPLFIRYGVIDTAVNVPRLLSKPYLPRELRDALANLLPDIERQYDRIKGGYPQNRKGLVCGDYVTSWSGKTIAKMAEECNLGQDYIFGYSLSSHQVHMSVSAVGDYFDVNLKKFRYHWSRKDVRNVLMHQARAFLMFLLIVDDAFSLQMEPNILYTAKQHGVSVQYGPFETDPP